MVLAVASAFRVKSRDERHLVGEVAFLSENGSEQQTVCLRTLFTDIVASLYLLPNLQLSWKCSFKVKIPKISKLQNEVVR